MNQWDQLTSGHKLDWDPKPNQDPKPAQTGTQNQLRPRDTAGDIQGQKPSDATHPDARLEKKQLWCLNDE